MSHAAFLHPRTGKFRPRSRCLASHQPARQQARTWKQEADQGGTRRLVAAAALLPPATTPPEQQRLDTTHTSTSVKHGTDDRTSRPGPAQVRVGGQASS